MTRDLFQTLPVTFLLRKKMNYELFICHGKLHFHGTLMQFFLDSGASRRQRSPVATEHPCETWAQFRMCCHQCHASPQGSCVCHQLLHNTSPPNVAA